MKSHSRNVVVLTFSSVLIGIYCLFAAIAIIVVSSAFVPSGSAHLSTTFPVGAFFLGLAFVSFLLAYGFWTRKSWSWIGGMAFFVALVVASAALSIISTNLTSTLLPLISAVAGVTYLTRPTVKAQLVGTDAPVESRVTLPDALEVAEAAR